MTHPVVFVLLIFPTIGLAAGSVNWIFSCAQQGLLLDWIADQPIEGSVTQKLVRCMVDHVMTSPFTAEELQLLPSASNWCLPDDFLSESRTCASLRFDIYEPIRYCIEEDSFPGLSDGPYAQGFNTSSYQQVVQSSFYLSTRIATSMCALLDGLRSSRGRECLEEVCRHASHSPSQEPSSEPSIAPSSFPSHSPSGGPSGLPSETPSTVPSAVPSDAPSLQPSTSPSSQPTQEASEFPSEFPTVETLTPSAAPTLLPSWYPTSVPTVTSSLGPGPFLQMSITLRVLLDGVSPNEVPLPDAATDALERALQDTVRSVQGFQTVEIVSVSKARVPAHAPIVLSFQIWAIRPCGDDDQQIDCADQSVATTIVREFRNAFEEVLQNGTFARAARRQASRHNVTSLLDVSPRPNSSNLMSSKSFIVASEEDKIASSTVVAFGSRSDGVLALVAYLVGTLFVFLL